MLAHDPIDVRAYLQLMRLPNVFTALADILAGYFIVSVGVLQGRMDLPEICLLLAASAGLYTGGIVLNDYFDAEVDRRERPGRPIPSGRVPGRAAGQLGWGLIGAGMAFAILAGSSSFMVALGIVIAVISYNGFSKGIPVVGPLNMGFCRYLNLTLGMSPALKSLLGDASNGDWSPLFLVPLVMMAYIATLTFLARMEAGSLKVQRGIQWMLLGIIPLDAAMTAVGAGPGYGAAVLALFIPAFILSKVLYMT
jgi:4-hydroxybenzoate polyprenyltransferase